MRETPSLLVECGRILDGPYGTSMSDHCNGAFIIVVNGRTLRIMASDGTDEDAHGWEHVSVSRANKCPTWEQMCWVKDQFWEAEEVVFQLHPKRSEYISHHPYCLHMWRHKVIPCPAPPSILVGPKGEGGEGKGEGGVGT